MIKSISDLQLNVAIETKPVSIGNRMGPSKIKV